MDEETKYHLQKVFASKETEEERLIRLGEMTPFGTDVAKKARKIIIPENELTDFDKFLLGEVEARAKKKAESEKKVIKHSDKKPVSSPSKHIVAAPDSSENSSFTTFTDLKAVSRKKTKPKIKLGSKYAKGYTKAHSKNKGLVKNYQSDSEVSDFAMDEGSDSISGSDKEYLPEQDLSDDFEDTNIKKGNNYLLYL